MNTHNAYFKYRATANLKYEQEINQLQFVCKDNNLIAGNEKSIQFFCDRNFKFALNFTKSDLNSNHFLLQKVILEKVYAHKPKDTEFSKLAYTYFDNFLDFMQLYYGNSGGITYSLSVEDSQGQISKLIRSNIAISTGYIKILPSLNLEKISEIFAQSQDTKDRNNRLKTYLKDCLLIYTFENPVIRLISASSLRELIGNEFLNDFAKNPKYKHTHDREGGFAYYENLDTSDRVLEIELLAVAARNLVSHGVVSSKVTREALNDKFGTPGCEYHHFDRNNSQHIQLIKWAADRFLTVIKEFLKAELSK